MPLPGLGDIYLARVQAEDQDGPQVDPEDCWECGANEYVSKDYFDKTVITCTGCGYAVVVYHD